MKKITCLLPGVLIILVLFLFFRPFGQIRLIVRGDDMGFCTDVNQACIDSYKNGILTTVEVMVPGPAFEEAAELLNENPGLEVGIHLTLTSEWDSLKWGPLTHVPSLTDSNGYFFPEVFPDEHIPPERTIAGSNWKIEEIEQELRAQIEKAIAQIPHCNHLSAHMGFYHLSPQVMQLCRRLAQEYHLVANLRMLPIHPVDLLGWESSAEAMIENGINCFKTMRPGTWIFTEHPGYDTPEMRKLGYEGELTVAARRGAVTEAFTSERLKKIIKERKIKLVGYGDLGIFD